MKVYQDEGVPVVKCDCGFKFVHDGQIRMKFALINIETGYICPLCPRCKRQSESFSIKILTNQGGNKP